jgi:myo-inositol-1(or 4)-monophosphatase
VSGNNGLNGALIGTGFPHVNADILHDYLAVIHHLLQTSHGIRRIGAAALDLAYVACGRLDGFIELGLKAWDVAAGALIVQEAGGTVTDMQGGSDYLFGRQIVASTPMLQASLLQLVGTHLHRWIKS